MSATIDHSPVHKIQHPGADLVKYRSLYDAHSSDDRCTMSAFFGYQPSHFLTTQPSAMSMLPAEYVSPGDFDPEYSHLSNALSDAHLHQGAYYDPFLAVHDHQSLHNHNYEYPHDSPHQETLEPRMMLQQHQAGAYDESPAYYPYAPASIGYGTDGGPYDGLPSTPGVETPHDQYMATDAAFSPASTNIGLSTPTSRYTEEEEDDMTDKPYARLIYEALMQAPDHKMMLRDIYEWFSTNTNKPRESGTNGWQNSIRHNLSMNQAFENDKSETSSRGQPRKANSMWILTEHAIKHGVQSTTRYRKSGTSKKYSSNRTAASERQKSGSKGGKAARRAAMLRRQEGQSRNKAYFEPSSTVQSPLGYGPDLSASPPEQRSTISYRPTTPADSVTLHNQMYGLPPTSSFHQPRQSKEEQGRLGGDPRLHNYLADAMYEELPKLTHPSTSSGTMYA